jgi:hypothetical protein
VRSHSHPLPSLMAKLCDPTAAVRQPGRLLELALGGPQTLRPRLTTGLPFSPAHQRCACRPTSLPIGYKFATIFEVVGIFFSDIFLVLFLLSRVARRFPQANPSLLHYSPECVEGDFCELRHNGFLRSSRNAPGQLASWWRTRSNFLLQARRLAYCGRVATTIPLS